MVNQNKTFKTADLYDVYEEKLQVGEPIFRHFGGHQNFHGPIVTVKCFEDNSMVKQQLGESGQGRVLVVDAGGSLRCAMLGDLMATKAIDNGWVGIVMFGCVRDSVEVGEMPIGVLALATNPRKSEKKGIGDIGGIVNFAGITFRPGEWLYADKDGIVVLAEQAG